MPVRRGEQRRQPARLAQLGGKHCACLARPCSNRLSRMDLGAERVGLVGCAGAILLQGRHEAVAPCELLASTPNENDLAFSRESSNVEELRRESVFARTW